MRIPLFRIWYSTTYTVLFAILLVLLAATPGDHIYQSSQSSVKDIYQNVSVIGGIYFLTMLVALFIYASRLYTNRMVLSAIPKSYIPIEPDEVGKHVRRMIVRHFERSAHVAWDARPRDLRPETQEAEETLSRLPTADHENRKLTKERSHTKEFRSVVLSASSPPWGPINHPGWCSPASDDLPNLQFTTVIPELPNLIEAKAVSLAPSDPYLGPSSSVEDLRVPDARVVAILQRPPTMGLRDYLDHLTGLGLIQPPTLVAEFLSQYEYARFSTASLTERQFRKLMSTFAAILNGMAPLEPRMVAELMVSYLSSSGSEISSLSSTEDVSMVRFHTPGNTTRAESMRSYSSASSTSHVSPVTARTAPSVGRPTVQVPWADSSSSSSSVGSVRRHPITRTFSGFSSASSARSGQSVIRLSTPGESSTLPYHIDLNGV